MKKNNTLLSKAISEANTIKSGAIKNAHQILLETLSPKITDMFNQVIKEQVGVHDQNPMDGPEEATYNQLDGKTDVQNPEDDVNIHGAGPQLLEDEGFENEDEPEMNEQEDEDMEFDFEDDSDEQEDSSDMNDDIEEQDDDIEFEIEDDTNEQEDDDMEFDFDDDTDEQEDSLDMNDDTLDMSDTTDEQDDNLEIGDLDEEPVEEQVEVSPETNPDVVKSANEAKVLKAKNAKLVAENKELVEGIEKLRKKIAQVNLFNLKVAAASKITSNSNLNESQKVKILDAFDSCKTSREVQMTFKNYKSLLKTLGSKNKIQEARLRNSIKPNQPSKIESKNEKVLSEETIKNLKLAGLLA